MKAAGTASNQFSSAVVSGWGAGFYMRLARHMQRASDAIGWVPSFCTVPAACGIPLCGCADHRPTAWDGSSVRIDSFFRVPPRRCTCGKCGAPAVVAFTGKRQFSELINHGKRVNGCLRCGSYGSQPCVSGHCVCRTSCLLQGLAAAEGAMVHLQGKAKVTNIPLGPQTLRPEVRSEIRFVHFTTPQHGC